MKETSKLMWPEGYIRTRIQDRETNPQWRKTISFYEDGLLKELERMDAVSVKITTNNTMQDPAVAVWFSRQKQADYSWQDLLGINNPSPTREEVTRAYRSKVSIHHPDQGGDIAMFQLLTQARDRALEWVDMSEGRTHNYVLACDKYKEVRLNLCAIKQTISALRTIERCGSSALMEKAFSGFAAITENASATTAA